MSQMTVDVPARGRKWKIGALVRDGDTLYRVTGDPVHYHEDCAASQKVAIAQELPADWQCVQRLLAIMQHVRTTGTPTPESSGARNGGAAPYPADAMREPEVLWEARRRVDSYAPSPHIYIRGDVVIYVESVYDGRPIMTWVRDQALADEARSLIASGPSLTRYPAVRVRVSG